MKPLNENFVLKSHSESQECRSRLLWYFSVSGCTVITNQIKELIQKQNIYQLLGVQGYTVRKQLYSSPTPDF